MDQAPRTKVFATPKPRHTLTLARGETVWRMSVKPWALGAGVALVALVALGSLGSSALFLMSDDVAAAFRAREAQTVIAYEQRIANLRRELDRAASREHAERRSVAEQVARMLDRQREIGARFDRMEPLLAEARSNGLVPEIVPVPTERPSVELDPPVSAFAPDEDRADGDPFEGFDLRVENGGERWRGADGDRAAGPFAMMEEIAVETVAEIGDEVSTIEETQIDKLSMLAEAAEIRTASIRDILGGAGLSREETAQGVGGPFVPLSSLDPFSDEIDRLADALWALRQTQETAARLPLGAPITGAIRTSSFGVRTDPFIRRRALHSGIDYAAKTGAPVVSTAAGTVVKAGWRGGYGLVVEIDHGDGHATRYAHLSATEVSEGQRIETGTRVGRVGSTGRSTGPHLHYEVLRSGKAVDPTRYLDAGRKLGSLG